MANLQKLGKNIKRCRENKGMTQAELAEALFVSFQAVSSWERGLTAPDLENAARLAELFGETIDTLLHDMEAELLVGIDGGGSKTEFLLFQSDGTVLNRILSGGSNPNDRRSPSVNEVLEDGLSRLLRDARPKQIFAGIAGTGVGNQREKIEQDLKKRFQLPIMVDTDAINVLSMAPNREEAGAVICGTGSVVFVKKESRLHAVGGWGHLFDLAGSAYDVGRDGIRLALAVYHGLEQPGRLTELVMETVEGDLMFKLPDFYAKGRSVIASYAGLVVQAAAEGDDRAAEILRRNAEYLAKLILAASAQYGISEFVAAGGFFKNQIYRDLVEEACGFPLYYPDVPPVYGACVMAMDKAGIEIGKQFRETFIKSYGRITC